MDPDLRTTVDVVIIGSGFAGSLMALALRARGQSVALVEQGRHPRFVIGESTTPLTNLLLEELADRHGLAAIRPFSKWGTWQATRPDVACGLKRGFTFVFHQPGQPVVVTPERTEQLLVAASPHDGVADTHWFRPDFDAMLVDEARHAGVLFLDEVKLQGFVDDGDQVVLTGTRHADAVELRASFVVDASGPRGFLARHFALGRAPLTWLPPTQGLYTHFTDVGLWEQVTPAAGVPPFPPDAAALHHVFPGGWIWVLRFNNGITSAGAAVTDDLASEIRLHEGEAAWHRLLDRLPSVREQFQHARVSRPFVHAPRVGFRCRQVVGPRWALLPSAAGVIDPLLSTGFPLTLLGIGRLLECLEHTGAARHAALAQYACDTQDELDVTEQLVGALYACMHRPDVFARLSLLYFAAASYAETVRRLGRPHLAPGFLLHRHPEFGPNLRACAALAAESPSGAALDALFARIDRTIEPFDTAGLLDRSRRNWYPVLKDDLIRGAAKLQASEAEVNGLLARCGL